MLQYKNLGLYVHLPFCLKKCPYCDFYSVNYSKKDSNNTYGLEKKYVDAVVLEIESYKNKLNPQKKFIDFIDTIYFGGGTPSILESENIKKILKEICKNFRVVIPEITIEINPKTVDESYLLSLKKMGINRISIGLQSANSDELFVLGRSHSADDVEWLVQKAKELGFSNISVDLMLGLPNQTVEKVKCTLDFVKKLDVQHVSAYLLQIEKNTKFNTKSIIEKLPQEEEISDIYLYVVNTLKDNGLAQYEISNFSKPGFESKHNLKYWNQEEYIGIGAAAHSFLNNNRYYIESNIYKYIEMARDKNFKYISEQSFESSFELISKNNFKNYFNEYIMLKLRLTQGIDVKRMKSEFPQDLVDEFLINFKKYYNKKYIYVNQGNISLTSEGFLIYNTIVSNLMID